MPPPGAPTGLTANPTGPNSVQLNWSLGGTYSSQQVLRDGSVIAGSLGGTVTSYLDNSCGDGVAYSYVIRAWSMDEPPESEDSTSASATTPLKPPTGLGGSGSPTSVDLNWGDPTGNETGFKIYRDGGYLTSVGANVTTYNNAGLSPGTWYTYNVTTYNALTESGPSNEINVFTADPPSAPSLLTAAAISTSQINLGYQDNSSNETGFKIEESADGATGWSQIGTVGAGVTTYPRTGLSSNTLRYYRVRAYNDSGNSGYSNIANARTFAAISDPTNLVATPFSDTKIEIIFQDNSSEEDGHEVYRKEGAGAYSLITTLEPNVDFYRDTGLTKGLTYTYKVRAKQGTSYSGYSNEAAATTISEPSAPTGLAISDIKDTSLRLTWTPTTGEAGYKIEKSTNGGSSYTEIAVIADGIGSFLVTSLTAGTEYYFKIRAYNIAGNSAYTAAVHDTTLASYVETSFEELMRRPISTLIYLVEINPKITLSGFTLTSGKTYTYEVGVEERGIDIEEVFENGDELTERSSIADVESNAGSFYFDFYGRKLYVHATGGDSPANYFIEGAFWLYFTNYSDPASPTIFNDKNYLPLLEGADIPDVNQEISPIHEGNFSIGSGSISIKNPRFPDGWYWDKRYARYTFRNRKVVIKVGGAGFAYASFEAVFTALITGEAISDERITFSLEDFRGGIHRDIPINHFWPTDWPNLADNDKGKEIPLVFGAIAGAAPVCCDPTNRKYKLNDGRIKTVSAAYKNGTALVANTDYFIDYQRGILILARGLSLDSADTITVNFSGTVNSADELLTNGADIFVWICRELLGLSLSELDLDSIYQTKYLATATLAAYIQKTTSSETIIRTVEQSIRAYTYQDNQGRLGLRYLTSTPASNARYIRNHHVSDFLRERSLGDLYSGVRVFYSQNPQKDDEWENVLASNSQAGHEFRVSKVLEIKTYLTTEAPTMTLAAAIRDELNKAPVSFNVPAIMFGSQAGDLFYFSRDRFPSMDGAANEVVMRTLSIQKQIGARKTAIGAEVVG